MEKHADQAIVQYAKKWCQMYPPLAGGRCSFWTVCVYIISICPYNQLTNIYLDIYSTTATNGSYLLPWPVLYCDGPPLPGLARTPTGLGGGSFTPSVASPVAIAVIWRNIVEKYQQQNSALL